jgi:hypothetical protein
MWQKPSAVTTPPPETEPTPASESSSAAAAAAAADPQPESSSTRTTPATPLTTVAKIVAHAGLAGVLLTTADGGSNSVSETHTLGKMGGDVCSCIVQYPQYFHRVRESFGINSKEFFEISLREIIELGNPGKGGQRLFRTGDLKYILKTMDGIEEKKMVEILPKYVEHMEAKTTCLCGFVSWITVVVGNEKTPLLVMRNILPPTVCGKKKLMQFDLKGSWHGRCASEHELEKGAGATLKDLDFGLRDEVTNSRCPTGLLMASGEARKLLDSINNAADFVADFGIMDHSLLLGIYDVTDVKDISKIDATAAGFVYAEVHDLRVDTASKLLPDGETRSAKLLLQCGVIDVLQTFNTGRKFQKLLMGTFNEITSLSSVPAPKYCERFKLFMEMVFGCDDEVCPVEH